MAFIFEFTGIGTKKSGLSKIEKNTDNPEIEFKVTDISEKFFCGCGSCNRKSLDICVCKTAQTGRQLIRNGLLSGKSEEDLYLKVASNYGYWFDCFLKRFSFCFICMTQGLLVFD